MDGRLHLHMTVYGSVVDRAEEDWPGCNSDERASTMEPEERQFPEITHRRPHHDQAVGQGRMIVRCWNYW